MAVPYCANCKICTGSVRYRFLNGIVETVGTIFAVSPAAANDVLGNNCERCRHHRAKHDWSKSQGSSS